MTIPVKNIQKIAVLLMVVAFFVAIVAPSKSEAALAYYPQTPTYYTYQYQNTYDLVLYLNSLIAQLNALQEQQRNLYTYNYQGPTTKVRGTFTTRYDDYDVDVETNRARNVDDEEATLYGEVDLDDADYVYVWFEYGTDGRFREETKEVRIDDNDDESFHVDVDDLDEDEKYYFRAVAEDPSGHRVYGNIESFYTDDNGSSNNSSDDDEPDVETGDADDVDEDSARMYGEVDMNDFDDGLVFFVYGEDEDAIEDVEDEDQYSDVDEDGDDLQKYKVYSSLDGYRSFWFEVSGLDDDTDHYFRICVEYEDEDDDEVLECGEVEHFETDRD